MSDRAPMLAYDSRPPPPRRLTLYTDGATARVEYPVPLAWAAYLVIAFYLAVGVLQLAMTADLMMMVRRMLAAAPPTPHTVVYAGPSTFHILLWTIAAPSLGMTCFWWLIAAYQWRMQRRFGHIPRTLTAGREGITRSWTGWWSLRQRHWPASELTTVEIRPFRDVHLWGARRSFLSVGRRGKGDLRFTLPTREPSLPQRIADAFRSVLFSGPVAAPPTSDLTASPPPPIVGQ